MKKYLIVVLILGTLTLSAKKKHKELTPVEKHGQLHIDSTHVVDEHGNFVQLKGMSFFWSQWMPQYYNKHVVKWLATDWKCSVVRPAMAVDHGGYLEHPYIEMGKIETVIDAAIKQGIYVIIDFHAHEAHTDVKEAKIFFADIAQKYGHLPNIIYETYNEPLKDPNWNTILKPYHEAVIDTIRHYDPDNIIVCGTRQWSQLVEEASKNPIKDANVAYSLHYYANTHKDFLREEALRAMKNGVCLMATEFGVCSANGNGDINYEESEKWFDFLEEHHITWCNWSIADKQETAAALKPGANPRGYWSEEELTESGQYLRRKIRGHQK